MFRSLITLFIFFHMHPASAKGVEMPTWKGPSKNIIRDYEEVLKRLSKNTCSGDTEKEYRNLLKAYRGRGFYVPQLSNNEVDEESIQAHLSEVQNKLKWIQELRKNLEKREEWVESARVLNPIQDTINELLELKKVKRLSEGKKNPLAESREGLEKLSRQFEKLRETYPFLFNYRYPVNHLENREKNDEYRAESGTSARKKANSIYFLRQILEDGAMDPDHTRPDVYLRTTLDTIGLNLPREKDYLSEDMRHDLEWSLLQIKKMIRRGKSTQISRLEEWEERTREKYDFYNNLVKTHSDEVVVKKSKAENAIRAFVMEKLSQVYKFFATEPELMQALFSIETILINEVGVPTDHNVLDRYDLAQIVLNRKIHADFSKLKSQDAIFRSLSSENTVKSEAYPWLNTLFKEGEFSFTYFYIPSVVRIFCPALSPLGKKFRRQNVQIALETLDKPRWDFNAIRYYSRVSMTGKIDMTSVWKGFTPIPHRSGVFVKNQESLLRLFKKGDYRYLYQFKDPKKRVFDVIEIQDVPYAVLNLEGKPVFYVHRNPHEFSYFSVQ